MKQIIIHKFRPNKWFYSCQFAPYFLRNRKGEMLKWQIMKIKAYTT